MQALLGLEQLEKQVEQDLQYLNLPIANWVLSGHQESEQHLDVAIIGGGMSGISAAFALKLRGIQALVFDQATSGQEGPWIKPALMETLRSPKQIVGPAMASPSLTFQAWFKAQFGDSKWQALDKIPRLQWGEYLQWFKKITAPVLYNQYRLIDIKPAASGVTLLFSTPKGVKQYHAEQVILAMGMTAFSEPNIPDFIKHIPQKYWEHAYDGTNYSRFKGLDLGVVGYSAGAMDSSATALEQGAKSVEILIRANDMPRVNRGKAAGSPGFTQAYQHFTDAQKWHYSQYVAQAKTPAPHGSTLRVSQHNNAFFNFNSPINQVKLVGNKLHVSTPNECFILDYLILATGYRINWQQDPAFAAISPLIKTWADAYTPPKGEENDDLSSHPYLGYHFELQARETDSLPGLDRLYCFNLAASVSMGPVIGLIPGTNTGAEKLADYIANRLYSMHADAHLNLVKTSVEHELLGDEWTVAVPYSTRATFADTLG